MKEMENYLWDKTGEDAEIAELENALAAFRYQETAPPALPAKILSFPAKEARKTAVETPRRRFSFRFALAAWAAIVLITFGVLLQFSSSKTATGNDLAQTSSVNKESYQEVIEENNQETQNDSIAEAETFTLENVETSPQIEASKQIIKQFKKTLAMNKTKPNVVKTRRAVSGENKTIAENAEIRNSTTATLTDEEKHAYDQLMLALSVTSKQLKIVKDKVNGIEDRNDDFANER